MHNQPGSWRTIKTLQFFIPLNTKFAGGTTVMKLIHSRFFLLGLLLSFILAGSRTVYAQEGDELRLRLNRDFGYSSLYGSQIQGTFSMVITGPSNLSRVVFYLDSQILEEVDEPPFSLRFVTDNYPLGPHALSVVGYTDDGRELRSNIIRTEFVSPGQGTGTAVWLIGGMFGVIVLGMGIAFLFGNVLGKGKKTELPLGATRRYGIHGGAICPNCSRPFAIHALSLNLMAARFDRCPYCGKWSFVRRAHPQVLKQAEAAELEWATPGVQTTAGRKEQDLLKDLEDSRYQDN
jgi:DNA-directed RNA polymerase subunit RPC12/RpoP